MNNKLKKNALFNPQGDTDLRLRRMIGGNTTNLNDFNNMRYTWASDWYRQAMNNFWIPEEINLTQDTKDYPLLPPAERKAYDKNFELFGVSRLAAKRQPSLTHRVYHGQRGEPLLAYSGFPRVRSQSELQLYARHYLLSRRAKRYSLPVENR